MLKALNLLSLDYNIDLNSSKMKNLHVLLILVTFVTFLVSCGNKSAESIPNPKVKADLVKLRGTVKYDEKYSGEKVSSFTISVVNPFTSEDINIEIPVDENGTFYSEFTIEVWPVVMPFYSSLPDDSHTLLLSPEKEINIDVAYSKNGVAKISSELFVANDSFLDLYVELNHFNGLYEHITKEKFNRFVKTPSDYIPFAIEYQLGGRLNMIEKDTALSDVTKDYSAYYAKLLSAREFFVFHQKMAFLNEYLKHHEGDTTLVYKPDPLDLSYYVFLKDFDLNDPKYLYQDHYAQLMWDILLDKTLDIPRIGDTPIDEWLGGIKERMVNLVGFEKGLFYDMLISTAYNFQLRKESKPFSEKQIQNIKVYFKGSEVEKILLRKNDEVNLSIQNRGALVVNETPDVPKEKLLETIVSKYKGKVVVVDLWATWCGPCLNAMKKMYPLKTDEKNKDVVFVYITNSSSPRDGWRAKIESIGGEHYYIEQEDQWNTLMNTFESTGIPVYGFFNTDGKLMKTSIGYPGIVTMQELIDSAK